LKKEKPRREGREGEAKKDKGRHPDLRAAEREREREREGEREGRAHTNTNSVLCQ
jgi:hypothetical protein